MSKLTFIIFVLLILGLLSFAVVIFLRPNQKTPLTNLIPMKDNSGKLIQTQTLAAWVWKSPTEIESDLTPLITFAKKEGINTLYVSIDEYIDIYEMPEGEEKDMKMEKYMATLKEVITKAKAEGITVHALSGNTAYSYDSHSYILPILVKHVFDFNQKNPESKLAGIQFDIEFYEDKRFWDSRQEYTDSYINVMTDTAKLINKLNGQYKDNVRLGLVIPFWFDEPNDYTSGPILKEVINSISKIQNSYLVVMAYRNTVDGKNGALDISEKELEEGDKSGVRIVIAQELVENKEAKISLFGKSKKEIKESLNQIIDGAKGHPSFEGVSINDIDAFMKVN